MYVYKHIPAPTCHQGGKQTANGWAKRAVTQL